MDSDLRSYMSREEREEMDALTCRARKRKERREDAVIGAKRFQFFECQCACKSELDDGAGEKTEKSREDEIEQLLKAVCDFCFKHNLCQCPYHRADREMQAWEDQMKLEEMERHEELLTGELPF